MSSSIPTPDSLKDEEPLRNRVNEGLNLALYAEIDEKDIDEYFTDTKREKLVYFATRDLELPLTYSFYLAGGCGAVKSATSGGALERVDQTIEAMNTGQPGFTEPDIDEEVAMYKDYFLSTEFFDDYDLEEVYTTNKYEFLIDYYEACGAGNESVLTPELAELYQHSTRLRRDLDGLSDRSDCDDEQVMLGVYGGGSDDKVLLSRNEELAIKDHVSELHMGLFKTEYIEDLFDPFTEGTDVIEQAVRKLAVLEDLTPRQAELVDGLDDFFYETVWKLPALKISIETATGPNADELLKRKQLRYKSYSSAYGRGIREKHDELVEENLIPELEDYSQTDYQELRSAMHELTYEVMRDEPCRPNQQ